MRKSLKYMDMVMVPVFDLLIIKSLNYIRTYIRMYVCTYVCMYVRMYVRMYESKGKV
jgi:hypothetical protein